MKTEYKRVELTTMNGYDLAEKLKESGWKEIYVGMFSVLFEKKEVE